MQTIAAYHPTAQQFRLVAGSSITQPTAFAAKSECVLGAHHVFWILVTLPDSGPFRAELVFVGTWRIHLYVRGIIK